MGDARTRSWGRMCERTRAFVTATMRLNACLELQTRAERATDCRVSQSVEGGGRGGLGQRKGKSDEMGVIRRRK